MKYKILFSILILIAIIAIPISTEYSQSSSVSTASIFPANTKSISHQQVLLSPGTTVYKQVSTCYNAVANMTVTNNSTIVQIVSFQSFFIIIILPNQPISNSTNTSLFSPNNILTNIDIFPSTPIIMKISFTRICLPTGTNPASDISLVYWDGSNLASWIPTFGANNTITWN